MCKTANARPKNNYSFDQFDKDMEQLDDILAKANISIDKRWQLYQPLLAKMPKSHFKLNYYVVAALTIVVLLVLFNWEELMWNLSAITRIAMIKILPYFDWRYLKNEECLVPKTTYIPEVLLDCNLCEALKDVDTFNSDNVHDTIYQYTSIDRPVIVTGAIDHWAHSSGQLIDSILNSPGLSTSSPCHVASNIHKNPLDLADLLQTNFDSFFIHFQNCQLEPMKIFRNLTYRPAVLPDELSPVTYNWLLWSNSYFSGKYRRVALMEKYTVIGQIVGSTHYRLLPRKNCEMDCPILEKELLSGDMLIFTSLWDLEYAADGDGERMAVVLEIKG